MPRKFRHIKTGTVAKQGWVPKYEDSAINVISYTYIDDDVQYSLDSKFVEDSKDWEEVEDLPIGTKLVDKENGKTRFIKTEAGWMVNNKNVLLKTTELFDIIKP